MLLAGCEAFCTSATCPTKLAGAQEDRRNNQSDIQMISKPFAAVVEDVAETLFAVVPSYATTLDVSHDQVLTSSTISLANTAQFAKSAVATVGISR